MSHTSKLEPIWFAPQRRCLTGWVCFKSSPSPPPAPDYKGAATATQQGSMVNQNTPYGSLNYTQDPQSRFSDNPSYSSEVNFSPVGQQLFDYGNQSALGMGELQQGAMGRTQQTMSQPFDQQSVQDTADRAYSNYTQRLDPQWEQRQSQQESQLANQGLRAGSEAYTNAMSDFNNARNDAYTTANTASIGTMPQTYQLAQALRNQPLNELNALRTGSQVMNPTFANSGQGGNYSQAAGQQGAWDQGLYNSGVGSANSFNTGLMGLGSALGSAWMMAPAASDVRLKSNIVKIGEHPLGIGIYEYDIFGHRDIGVMAQEVLEVQPEAVLTHPSGFLMVDYGRLYA